MKQRSTRYYESSGEVFIQFGGIESLGRVPKRGIIIPEMSM